MATALVVSVIISAIVQSRVLALAPPNLDYQKSIVSGDEDADIRPKDSAFGGSGDIYEVGTFESGDGIDFNPGSGTDIKLSGDGDAGFIRISGADGSFKQTLVIRGDTGTYEYDGDTYEETIGGLQDNKPVRIAFSQDKSTYYVIGNFWGTVDFDPGVGEVLKSGGVEEENNGFIAAYSAANNSLQKVSVTIGVNIMDIAVSPTTGALTIVGQLFTGSGAVDLNPDAGTDIHTAEADIAGFVSFYNSSFTYQSSYIYDNGDDRVILAPNVVTYDSTGRLFFNLWMVPRDGMSGFSSTVDFNPAGGANDDYTLNYPDWRRDAMAVVRIASNGTYEGAWVVQAQATSSPIDLTDIVVDGEGNTYFMGFLYGQFDVNPVTGGGNVDSRTYTRQTGFVAKMDSDGQFVYFRTATQSTSAYSYYYRGVIDSNDNLYLLGSLINYDSESESASFDLDPTAGTDTVEFTYGNRGIITRFDADDSYAYTVVSQPGAVEGEWMSIAMDGEDRPYASIKTANVGNVQSEDDCEMYEQTIAGMATARFSASGATNSSNWLDLSALPDVYVDGCDADDDGISDADEGNILNGDANGDEEQDRTQDFVSALTNPVTNKPVALEVSSACAIQSVAVKTEAETGADSEYAYPLGLLDFTTNCGTPGYTATIKQIYYDPPEGNFILRKFANGSYTTVDSATIERTTLNGHDVIIATYEVTDGGSLDADGVADGVIVDPAGLALAGTDSIVTVPSAPNTGVGAVMSLVSVSILPALSISAAVGILVVTTRVIIRSRR